MEKPRIYLETTVFSFYHETREYGGLRRYWSYENSNRLYE